MSLKNISIMGEGNITGGSYNTLRVMGEGRVLGDVEVGKLSIMGTLSSENNLKVGNMSVSGEGRFSNVEADRISVMGDARFSASLRTDELKIMGSVEVKERIKAQKIKILGTLEGKNAESEIFDSKGSFELESLNANDIRVKLRGASKCMEMGGEEVNISYPRINKIFLDTLDILLFRKTKRANLTAGTIEADKIYLENTIADFVTGNSIVIGHGCKIKNIEYRQSLYIDKSSTVENNSKI